MNTVHELFTHPTHAPCIVEDVRTHSYGDVIEGVKRAQETLRAKGIHPQDIVTLTTNGETPSIIPLLALLDMECSVLLTNSRWPPSMITEAVERVAASHVVSGLSLNEIEIQPTTNKGPKPSWATEAAVIVATSGSTGTPKLALLSLSALSASARIVAPACALTPSDRWLLSLPLFHVGGLGILFRTLITGSSLSVSRSDEGYGPATTHLSLVPTQLYRLLGDSRTHEMLQTKKVILLGGAPIGARIISECRTLTIPVMTTYGLTEMGSAVTLASKQLPGDGETVSLGSPLSGMEMRLSPDGEVLTRGATRFRGYITPDGLSLPLVEGDWFPTGDIGEILPDQTLAIRGRRDAQFISGGENIHPEMIEHALTALPGIMAACVVPVPDAEFGCRPTAFVVSKRQNLDISEIRESLRSVIPSFALPTGIEEAPQELLTASGKINRALAIRLASQG